MKPLQWKVSSKGFYSCKKELLQCEPKDRRQLSYFLSTSCERIISCLQDKGFFRQQSERLSTSMNISQHQWDCWSQIKRKNKCWACTNGQYSIILKNQTAWIWNMKHLLPTLNEDWWVSWAIQHPLTLFKWFITLLHAVLWVHLQTHTWSKAGEGVTQEPKPTFFLKENIFISWSSIQHSLMYQTLC